MLWLQIAFIFLLILLNGFFAMAEMAVVSARRARRSPAPGPAGGAARLALELKRDPGRFLSTVQIGITVISVLASVFGGATLADTLAHSLQMVPGAVGEHATSISFTVVVIVIAYVTLVLGELVPKRVALSRPEFIAARLCALRTTAVVPLPLPRPGGPPPVTEEEITLMLREAPAAGHFQAQETA